MKISMQLWLVVALAAGSIPLWGSGFECHSDTFPSSIPISNNPYYEEWEVPSQMEGHLITGGRFDQYDLTNIVYHAPIKQDTAGLIERLGDSWIDFFDMDNQLLGTFNMTANNPYRSENYDHFLGEGYMDVSRSIVDRTVYPDYDWREDVVSYATVGGVYENAQCGTLVVAYYLQALGADRTLLGVVATFVLLDSEGNEIGRFEDLEDVFFGEGLVTCDEQYFAFRYGGAFTEEEERMYNDHFRIYDIASKKLIYDWELPGEYTLTGPSEQKGGWIWVSKMLNHVNAARRGQPQVPSYHAFDIDAGRLYVAPADQRLSFIQSFTMDGFLIKDPETGETERIYYRDWVGEDF